MTNENDDKPPMFGPAAVIDPATYQPRAGKSFFMDAQGEVIGNSPQALSFIFDPNDNGHTLMFGTTRNGMSAMFDVLQDQYANAGGAVQVVDVGPTAKR